MRVLSSKLDDKVQQLVAFLTFSQRAMNWIRLVRLRVDEEVFAERKLLLLEPELQCFFPPLAGSLSEDFGSLFALLFSLTVLLFLSLLCLELAL